MSREKSLALQQMEVEIKENNRRLRKRRNQVIIEMWNDDKEVEDIADRVGLSTGTIRDYVAKSKEAKRRYLINWKKGINYEDK